jgi:EmrB/QacA subfamily drug resistance transporter
MQKPSITANGGKITQNKTSIIIVAVLAAFLPPFMASAVTVALPSMGRDFALPAVALSWLITVYLLSVAVFLVPFGKAGDMYGRRNIFLVGTILFTVASLFCAMVPNVAVLFLFRIVQGIGGAMIFSTGTAMLTAVADQSERGKLLGMSVSSTYLGLSLGPTLGGLLTQHFGWKSVFYANVPIGLIITIMVIVKIRYDRPVVAPQNSFDIPGSIIYGLSLVAAMYGLSKLPDIQGIIVTLIGILGFVLFAVVEEKARAPVLNLSLFRKNPVFLYSNLAALFNYSAAHGAGFLMSLYLQYVKGFPPKYAGLIMITQPLLMAAFSPLAGRLSDRIESRVVASAGMTMTAAGLCMFCFIGPTTSLHFIITGFAILGIGISFFSSPNTSAVLSAVEKQHLGMASSIVGTMRLIGQVLSLGIATLIISHFLGHATITTQNSGAFIQSARWSYLVFALLCMTGIAASLARGRMRTKKQHTT